MADVKWIKIVTDIFDDEKVKFIETMPNGDALIVIWFKLLCLTGKSNSSGFLMMTNKLAYTEEMLSSIFSRDIKTIQLALKTFEQLEMIEILDNKIYVTNWEKHQSLDKLEAKKVYDREYQRKKREEKKLLIDNRTTIVRQYNDNRSLDIDKDKELEKELEKDKEVKKKEVKKETFKDVVSRYTQNPLLIEAIDNYVEMRKKEKGFTPYALKLNLNKLDKLASDDDMKIQIVMQSICKTWKSFYELKEDKQTKRNLPDWYTKKYEPKEESEPVSNDVQKDLYRTLYMTGLEPDYKNIGISKEDAERIEKEVKEGMK